MDELERTARARFGYDRLRPEQREVVEHLLAGGDALVVWPTGGGKSLCYQLPALLRPGLTVVLSPLVALMQDQVDALRRRGVAAAFVNATVPRPERERRTADAAAGRVKLLYVTPERFRKPEFLRALEGARISLLAVDEAHCVSQWGHDFRPEYGRIARIREFLGRPPTVALTATLRRSAEEDVLERIGIPNARVFRQGLERENLLLSVTCVEDEESKRERIVSFVRRAAGSGIVYFALIEELLRYERVFQDAGIGPLVYHGELPAAEKRRVQRRFLEEEDVVVLATNAFGMGIDKPNIRFVLHAQAPGSLEALVQEVGRAGRDGLPSVCEVVYLEADLAVQRRFAEWKNPDPRFLRAVYDVLAQWGERRSAFDLEDLKDELLTRQRADGRVETALGLLEAAGVIEGSLERRNLEVVRALEPGEERRLVPEGKREADLRRLLEVVRYVREARCRKAFLHEAFGVPLEAEGCGACDLCLGRRPEPAARTRPRGRRENAGAPVGVGDWIEVNGRFPVAVRDVWRRGDRWFVRALSAGDLRLRTYDLARVRWRPLERG